MKRSSAASPSKNAAIRVPPTSAAEPSTLAERPVSSAAERPRRSKLRGKAQLLGSKEVYKGRVFSVCTDTVLEPGAAKPNTRDVIRHSGSVVILAADTTVSATDPEIVLIRQYRHAAGQFLLELPAGRIDPGEAALAAAKREMIEETGFRAKRWSRLVRYFASPGFLGEWMQIFLAEDLRAGTATPEEDEHIELVRMRLSAALQLLRSGEIHDGKTIVGLSTYQLRLAASK